MFHFRATNWIVGYMKKYHKIQTVYKRDMDVPGRKKPIIEGKWTRPEFFYLKDVMWDCYEKVDGTNIRIKWDYQYGPPVQFDEHMMVKLDLEFAGKQAKSQMPPQLLRKLGEIFNRDMMKKTFDTTPVCMYGEGYGKGIQKNGSGKDGYIFDDVGFILFDIRIGRWWLLRDDLEKIAESFNIPIVPLVKTCTLIKAIDMVKYGFTSHLRLAPPEGLVAKPTFELFDRKGERIITKLKLEDFKGR